MSPRWATRVPLTVFSGAGWEKIVSRGTDWHVLQRICWREGMADLSREWDESECAESGLERWFWFVMLPFVRCACLRFRVTGGILARRLGKRNQQHL